MSKPIVAVVGRPNVGKSTLVNRLAESRDAIVHESRGVTRDRSYHTTDWNGREFVLIDTGGIESVKSKDVFAPRIREQALAACDEADVIIFVVDGTVGVTDEDEEVARVVRKTDKPAFLCVNKLDNPENETALWDFWSLGVGEPRAISAGHGHGTGDLLDDVVAAFPPETDDEDEEPEDDVLNVAIIGRPNVGKSSLANRLAKRNRSIVSDVAGTTRDAIDTMIEWKGQRFRLVDTAGMRKKTQVHEDVEYYSLVRGLEAMDRADVCLLVVDASVGVTEQDQKLLGMAVDRGCALVILLNKWDLITTEEQRNDVAQSLTQRLIFAPWAPSINVSALTGRAVAETVDPNEAEKVEIKNNFEPTVPGVAGVLDRKNLPTKDWDDPDIKLKVRWSGVNFYEFVLPNGNTIIMDPYWDDPNDAHNEYNYTPTDLSGGKWVHGGEYCVLTDRKSVV